MTHRNILLLEPGYKNKYPPLGLMKIAQYHHSISRGKDNIVFAKGEYDPKLEDYYWDRIYITTLFSFEWKKTALCIDKARELVNGRNQKIFVGGIAASLMTDEFKAVGKWQGIRFISGLLDGAPAQALQLTGHDFGCKDCSSPPIEEHLPDYGILDQIDYQYPVNDAYFGYASRGCIRKCSFCGVPKLEGGQRIMPPISTLVNGINDRYGVKKDLILMDNNFSAASNFNEVVAEIRDLGFTPGARLKRNGTVSKRRVDFNQGVDARLLSKNPNLLKGLSTICISPLRIAFDHLGLRKPYEKSIREAAQHDITSLSNYMLYNFHDTPDDLYHRLILNIKLNNELGIRIWSFPMRYQPVNLKDRSFVGKNWNRYFLRSFQVILQATRGVVTGNPEFFFAAFGSSVGDFKQLLLMPHEFIFNRNHYFRGAGRPVLDEYIADASRLTENQRNVLITQLSLVLDASVLGNQLQKLDIILTDSTIDSKVRQILRFYRSYGRATTDIASPLAHKELYVPDDERVEDAGLYEA